MDNNKRGPVWDVYDEYRTARLNVKYFSHKVDVLQRWNSGFEISMLIFAPTSAIAAWELWSMNVGEWFWKVLMGITALIATIKPVIGLTKKIKNSEKMLSLSKSWHYDLHKLVLSISQSERYDESHRALFKTIIDKKEQMVNGEFDGKPDRKVIEKLMAEVNEELPVRSFYIPK